MAQILLIEDDRNLCRSLKDFLAKEGYTIETAENIKIALEKLTATGADLIVLDWMLPDGQGLDFLIGLRKSGNSVPVIFLTARVDVVDKVLGLEMGASDYLTKPFEARELLARIRVRLREAKPERSEPELEAGNVQVGALTIDRVRHRVTFQNSEIDLVKKEFDLLLLLAESPGKVFSRDEILNKVWGYEVFPTTRTVDTHIMLLRQKVHVNLIETVRAVGYRLKVL